MFTKSLITAGLVGLALCTQPAAAQPMQRLVQYADLDLSSAKGQEKLDARLRSAANAVCGGTYGPQPLSEAMEARRCYRNALTAAYRQVASIGQTRLARR